MLGLRGCRLGLDDPGLREGPDAGDPQRRRSPVKKAGGNPKAKIMIPLVGHVNELRQTRELLEAEATAVEERRRRGRLQVRHDDRGAARER